MNETDVYEDRVERWLCDPPPKNVKYQVLDDEWDETTDPPVRTIKRIRLVEP